MNYKIALITLCYNETPIMPFVLDYWKKFVTHAYVFDNGSTDNSREILSSHDWISVMDYSHITGNKFDDFTNVVIKNEFWKTIKNFYDFIVVCDFDECLYCEQWEALCNTCIQYNVNCIIPGEYYDMITDKVPEHYDDKLFHEYNKFYIKKEDNEINRFARKMLMFRCKDMIEINIGMGGHTSNPVAIKEFYGHNILTSVEKNILNGVNVYHLCCLGLDYLKNRRLTGGERMSQMNKDNFLGIHYLKKEKEIEEEYYNNWNNKLTIK